MVEALFRIRTEERKGIKLFRAITRNNIGDQIIFHQTSRSKAITEVKKRRDADNIRIERAIKEDNKSIKNMFQRVKKSQSKSKSKSISKDIKRAKMLGKLAFKKGIKSSPVLDKKLMNMLKGSKVGDPRNIKIMKAWTKSWHTENLKPNSKFGSSNSDDFQGEKFNIKSDGTIKRKR